MDAGIAAVLGAAAGTVGTFASGWASRSVARMQVHSDAIRERTEPRRASYEAFASSAAALQNHLAPWITHGRHFLPPSFLAGDRSEDSGVIISPDTFKEGYISRAVELADEIATNGRRVILNGPLTIEPEATKVMELSKSLVGLFRVMHELKSVTDNFPTAMGWKTSHLPKDLELFNSALRAFLKVASSALDQHASQKGRKE
ncbi:hypothetical protein ACIRQH_09205 [Streptomyces sp. NPDC102279]|uniref:hypothetical protein n=1 Tax=Streptomyces sp. NPDC102279 TaxID=3366153 RepID=UPI0037FCBDE8